MWIHQQDLLGFIEAYCPYIGYVTILMNDYPLLKFALLGVLGLSVFFSNDPDE